jgi:hypothetical protein
MLDHWGYRYLAIGTELTHMEASMEVHLGLIGPSEKDRRVSDIREHNIGDFAEEFLGRCQSIKRLSQDQELAAIPGNLIAVEAKIILARDHGAPLYATDLLNDIRKLKNDFALILSRRWFYALSPEAAEHYGLVAAFGEQFWEKFRNARDDLEHAGNCLALGEGTACVLHLMRMMEIVIRDLGGRLGMTFDLKDTWGGILRAFDAKIEAMPAATADEQSKKHQWSECRNYLWHVKKAHRDDSMHGTRSYSPAEAKEVLNAIKDFAVYLITL